MSPTSNGVLAIHLDDGRLLVARPGPEDQGRLEQFDDDSVLVSATSADFDTSGHAISDELTVDVEGHAMTLRLPTPADAEALRRALIVGAVTATIVAAGAVAALQNNPPSSSTIQNTITRPAAPAPAEDFQTRRERQIDRMLEAPPAEIPAADAPTSNRVGGPRE